MIANNQYQQALQGNKPLIMGILNLTPDSFSDGGKFNSTQHALDQAIRMTDQGADIIDIGGESTRPGSTRVSPVQQIERIIPPLEKISHALNGRCAISVDTTSSQVASAAIKAGASIINDVSAGTEDPLILKLAAQTQTHLCLMHMQGTPGTMQENPQYDDVMKEIILYLQQRITVALDAGVQSEQIIIDPGIGFGKRRIDNLQVLANLDQFVALGYRVLLGTSRKRFMGAMLENPTQDQLAVTTATTTALGVMSGVKIFRVHDVEENRIAANMAFAIKHASTN